MKVQISNPIALYAAALHISREETQYYINGVFVEQAEKGAYYTATDGHRLLVAYDKDAVLEDIPDDGIILPIETKFMNDMVKPNTHYVVWEDDVMSCYGVDDMMLSSIRSKPIDGTFPDWRRIFPKKITNQNGYGYNPTYLALYEKIAKVLKKHGIVDNISIRISPNGEKPSIIQIANCQWMRAILMPMRWSEEESVFPTWLDDTLGNLS